MKDRYKAFRYLDNRSVEAFRLLSLAKEERSYFYSYDYNDYDNMIGRYKVFRYLDNKSIDTIELVCDHPLYDPLDPYKLYNYLNNLRFGYVNEYNSKKSAKK